MCNMHNKGAFLDFFVMGNGTTGNGVFRHEYSTKRQGALGSQFNTV
jgi:hypothetical protein